MRVKRKRSHTSTAKTKSKQPAAAASQQSAGAPPLQKFRDAPLPEKRFDATDKRWTERANREIVAWLRRPRLHTAIFAEAWRDKEITSIASKFGVSEELSESTKQAMAARTRELEDVAKKLGWSNERLALFQKLVVEYRREMNIERYVQIRRSFPEVEIQVAQFGGIDSLFALQNDFAKQGVDPDLIAGALDADEPSIDRLCLCLLELLVVRDKIPKRGPGSIEARRKAISDAAVNYLISTMLEAFDWNEDTGRIPASFVVLVRHQLCGVNPDLHTAYRSKEKRSLVAMLKRFPSDLNRWDSQRLMDERVFVH